VKYVWPTATREPSDIEMMCAPCSTAHWMPARIWPLVPLPWSLSTLPTSSRAPCATPYRRCVPGGLFGPAAVPAQCVPCEWPSCTGCARDERLARDHAPGEVGVAQVDAVSSTAIRIPAPPMGAVARIGGTACTALRPHV
jgi:hypothetical protein